MDDFPLSGAIDPVKVAAVVVTYKRPDAVRRTLESLRNQTRPLDFVVVVDNSADLDIAEILTEFPLTRIVTSATNSGAAGGFAQGVSAATELGANWVLLANDDDCLRDSALEKLLARVHGSPTVVGVVGYASVMGEPRPVGATFGWRLRYPTSSMRLRSEYDADLITFAGALFSVAAINAAGGIRDDYFMMWEEFDLCLRIRRRGGRLVVLTQPLVDLPEHGSGTPYPAWRGYYEARNSLITLRSLGERRAWLWWMSRQAKFMVGALTLPNSGRRVGLRLRGILDGLRDRTGRTVEPW